MLWGMPQDRASLVPARFISAPELCIYGKGIISWSHHDSLETGLSVSLVDHSSSMITSERGPCTPYANTCAISADFDGPEMSSGLVGICDTHA